MVQRAEQPSDTVKAAELEARGRTRAAWIGFFGVVLGAVLAPAAGFVAGWLQYTGPGGAAPETSVVTVEAEPSQETSPSPRSAGPVYLVDLDPTGGADYQVGIARIDSHNLVRSISDPASCRGEREIEFPLDRKYTTFSATVGPSDESSSGTSIAFTASVDDRMSDPVVTTVGFGAPFEIDVTGGFRLLLSYEGYSELMA